MSETSFTKMNEGKKKRHLFARV